MQRGNGNWWNRGRGGFGRGRGRGGFQARFPNRGAVTESAMGGGVQCWRCGEFGHPASICTNDWAVWDGGMPLANANFGPARGSPRAGQGYSFNPGSICGHCGGQGHGRADCTNPGANGQLHLGGRNRCIGCIGVNQQQQQQQQVVLTPQSTGTSSVLISAGQQRPIVRLPQMGALRSGDVERFIVTGAIRAVHTTPTPGCRRFWEGVTNFVAEGPDAVQQYGLVSFVSIEAEIQRTSASTTTGTLTFFWTNSATIPSPLTVDWVNNRWEAQRLAAQEDRAGLGVVASCNFTDERGARRVSRVVIAGKDIGSRFCPTFVWNNDGTATYSVRYRIVLLCREKIAS